MHEVVTFDRALVRYAAGRFYWSRFGPFIVLAALGLVACFFTACFVSGWTYTMAGANAVLLACVAVPSAWCFRRVQMAEKNFDLAGDSTVTLWLSDAGLRIESASGTTERAWSDFRALLRYEHVWLLVEQRGGYITVPLDQVSGECRELIERKLTPPTAPSRVA